MKYLVQLEENLIYEYNAVKSKYYKAGFINCLNTIRNHFGPSNQLNEQEKALKNSLDFLNKFLKNRF